MKKDIPAWAMRKARPEDRADVLDSQGRGTMRIRWPEIETLRDWARHQEWPAPRFGFENAFLTKMLESDASFERALRESGVEVLIPEKEHTISAERLGELDALYEERSTSGRPVGWGSLVEELREIRRAVEAGVAVKVEDRHTLRTWQGFYGWAHDRYHALEDGVDPWIGDDNS